MTITSSERARAWPPLPLEQWRDTYATLHMWLQIVGKIRLALAPRMNHWWEVPLYLTARGLTTSPMPWRGGAFDITFDFIDHRLTIETSEGRRESLALVPKTVAEFYATLTLTLGTLAIQPHIWPMPVEIPDPIRFDRDTVHGAYDADAAHRWWRALVTIDGVLKAFRAGFIGKSSPVHFFWGSCDLAVTRFSGRRAPARPDPIMREAYSHEVISAGFWPGGSGVPDAAFYAYAAPEPAGLADASIAPGTAFYSRELGEFILMYDTVRTAEDPAATLFAFLDSTYGAAANLAGWDRPALERT